MQIGKFIRRYRNLKRFFALILVLLMIIPMVVACNKEEESESSSSTSSSITPPDESSSTTPDPGYTGGPLPPPNNGGISSKDEVITDWSGKTLNVLVTRYGANASYPWGQVELCADTFGEGIGQAYDERQAEILSKYGVEVDWIPAQANQFIATDLATAELSDTLHYDIAIPRVNEVQALVSSVYNMRESDYLDFNNDYFSLAAYEAFTVSGYTLFAAGGHDFADDQSSYVMLFNKELLAEKAPAADLYAEIKNGNWTYEGLSSISQLVKGDDGNGTLGDEDTYGFGVKSIDILYYCFGIFEADVDPDTGMYRFAFDLDAEKVDTVIALMKSARSSDWARTSGWGGDWGSNMHTAFEDGRLLFFYDVAQKITELKFDFSYGIVPFPKLNAEQEDYIVPVNREQITVICIPRVTQDRQMSEYFIDVLAWTGNDYTVAAYYDTIEATMDMETAEDDMEIIVNYVFKKIDYDIGCITCGSGTSLLKDIKDRTLGDSSFAAIMLEERAALVETVQSWNNAWAGYDGDME